VIENVTLRDFYFDGILLTGNRGCARVTVRGCVSENNRRTGLAIPAAADVSVEGSAFRGSRGQSPEAGINCEPGPGAMVNDVRIAGSTFEDNAGIGVYAHRALGVAVSNVDVTNNVVSDNGQGIVVAGVEGASIVGNRVEGHRGHGRSAIAVGDAASRVVVASNRLEGNLRGIVSAGATGVEIRANEITGLASRRETPEDADGIVCRGLKGLLPDACAVLDNVVRDVAGSGVVAQLVSRVEVRSNRIEGAGQRGIYLRSTTESEVTLNDVAAAGRASPGVYDAIELAFSANDNLVAHNTCRAGPETRRCVSVGPGCLGNRVFGNVLLPWKVDAEDAARGAAPAAERVE
jgi:parallel beta-helix repeat protein